MLALLLGLALAQAPVPTHRDRGIALLQKGDVAVALPEL